MMIGLIQNYISFEKVILTLIAIGYYLYFYRKNELNFNDEKFLFGIIVGCVVVYALNPIGSHFSNILSSITFGIKYFILAVAGSLFVRKRKTIKKECMTVKRSLLCVFLAIVWSGLIQVLIRPEIDSSYIVNMKDYSIGYKYIYILLLSCFVIPVSEEIYYRLFSLSLIKHFIRNERLSGILSIAITSLSFLLSHVGIYTDNYIKILQLFPITVILGVVANKYNIKWSMVIHVLFNVITMFIELLIMQ